VVQETIIDGRVYFDRARDMAGRADLEKEKKSLLEKEKKAAEKKPDATVEMGKKSIKPGTAKPDATKSDATKPPDKTPAEPPKPPQNDLSTGGAR
jgi:hypothetical protein